MTNNKVLIEFLKYFNGLVVAYVGNLTSLVV